MKHTLLILMFASSLLAIALPSQAQAEEYRWISDVLYVPLRGGKGNQYRILDAAVKSGTRLKYISEDKDWVELQDSRGQRGFVRKQYVTDKPTAALQLAATEAKYQKLQDKYDSLTSELNSTSNTRESLIGELRVVKTENQSLSQELDEIKRVSSDAIALNSRHQQLLHDFQLMQTEMDVLKADNQRLKRDNRNTFFVYGALAVLLGVIIAVIVPSLKRRKRYSEWA